MATAPPRGCGGPPREVARAEADRDGVVEQGAALASLSRTMARDLDRLALPGARRLGASGLLEDQCSHILHGLAFGNGARLDLELFWRVRHVLPAGAWAAAYDLIDGWLAVAGRALVDGRCRLDRRCSHPAEIEGEGVCGRPALPGSGRCRRHRLPALVRPIDV